MNASSPKLYCKNFGGFMRTEKDALYQAINEDKWYLSERAGYDVGWDYAKRHFVMNYLNGFAERYRAEFCEKRCSYRDSCDLYHAYRQQCGTSVQTAIF